MIDIIVNARFLTQEISGVQRYASEISLGLRALDPQMRFVAPRNIRQADVANTLNVEIVGRSGGHVWEQMELPRFVSRGRNALLVNLANTAPLAVSRQIVTIQDLSFMVRPEWFGWRFRTLYRFLVPRLVRQSMHIVAGSDFTRQDLLRRFRVPPSKISVVYSAVSARLVDALKVGTPPVAGDYILAVSSLDPRKNLSAVVQAHRLLKAKGVKLVIVGASHRTFADPRLDLRPDDEGKIVLLGRVDDSTLSSLYRHARVFVYPSLHEGFGLPPLEAMANGCPCVASRETALPEVLGDAAQYCDPRDIREIAIHIDRLLIDSRLRSTLIERGRVRARQFSWEKSAEQMHSVIRTVAGM